MPDPFVSVIIPVYNAGNTIASCLESVFKSTYRYFECILVDDHSNDNTLEVAKFSKTKLIRLKKHHGAAHARNCGAEAAQGDILLFVDSDVKIRRESIEKVVTAFNENPDVSALFGSYDDRPESSNFFSQYKNLFHHYIHQTSQEDASTFWSGCGAIKKEVFFEVGKFNNDTRMMEDIELGYKLKSNGYKIRLMKDLTVKHLKHYTFFNILKSDFFDRAIPWTILMLNNSQHACDLNLKLKHKLSAVFLMFFIVSIYMTINSIWFIFTIPILLFLLFLMNYDFYKFFSKKKGIVFALKVIPLHFFYYLYSSLGFCIGVCMYLYHKQQAARRT